MKTAKDNKAELDFYVAQAKSLQGEISIPILISELRVGHQKATQIFERLKGVEGIELAITPEPEETIVPVETILENINFGPEDAITADESFPDVVEAIANISYEQVEEVIIPDKSSASTALEVVDAATAPFKPGEALSYVLTKFDLGDGFVQLAPKDGETVTDEELSHAIPALFVLDGWNKWATGDLVRELDKRNQGDAVTQICAMANRSCKTLRKWATVAERVPVRLRDHSLDFTQFQEIAEARYSKDAVEQAQAIEELIIEAKKEGYNVEQTREAVLNRQGKTTAPTPPPAQKKHGRFIVISSLSCEHSFSTDNLPDVDENHIVVDCETGSISCHSCSGLPTWIPLPIEALEATAVEAVVEE